MLTILAKLSNRIDHLRCKVYLYFLKYQKQIYYSDLSLKGIPIIDARNGGLIKIGSHVLLNSRNYGYHLNLYGPVKLFADRPGAEITIGDYTRIHGSCIHTFKSIKIGRNCLIAGNCQIIDANGHEAYINDVNDRINSMDEGEPIVIEDSVWIGANTIVLPGVRIGYGSVIGAGSVVTKDIPPMVLAAGSPAKVIRDLDKSAA